MVGGKPEPSFPLYTSSDQRPATRLLSQCRSGEQAFTTQDYGGGEMTAPAGTLAGAEPAGQQMGLGKGPWPQ